jgi:glutamine amidotransferase
MSSNRAATISLSLVQLAEHGGLTAPHKDGWGVAFYEDTDVRLVKDASPAAESDWIGFLRDHHLRSQIVIAHLRTATTGARAYRNTQPFVRELAGRMHVFAHNGWLREVRASSEFGLERFCPVGETDSEWAFCALLEKLADVWKHPGEVPSIDARMRVIADFAQRLRPLGPANFLYSDSDTLFAHGDRRMSSDTHRVEAPGLVYLQRWCARGEPRLSTTGLSIESADQTITLVASVPLTKDAWLPFEEGEVIAISNGQLVARAVG